MIPDETLKKWSLHCTDLNSLSTVFFPRSCVNEDSSNYFVIFTDASKLGYGFAVYSVADGCSNLLYAKSQVASLKGTGHSEGVLFYLQSSEHEFIIRN